MCNIVNPCHKISAFVNHFCFQSVCGLTFIPFRFVIQLLHVLSLGLISQFLPNFALVLSLTISVFWLIYLPFPLFILSPIQTKREKEREYTSRKLLSHTVQEGDSMSKIKQCSLATQWKHSCCLCRSHRFFPPLSFTKSLYLLHLLFRSFCIFSQQWR